MAERPLLVPSLYWDFRLFVLLSKIIATSTLSIRPPERQGSQVQNVFASGKQQALLQRPPGAILHNHKGCPRLVSSNYWKLLVPKHLHYLGRLPELMKNIMEEPDISLEIRSCHALASRVLEQAHQCIRALQGCFKIGLTSDPVHRWSNSNFGYKHSLRPRFQGLKIIGVVAHGEAAGFLEAALISAWSSDPRCLNVAGGGETISRQEGPFFVYAVVSNTV